MYEKKEEKTGDERRTVCETLYVAGKEEALHRQLLFGIRRGHLVFRGSGFGNLLFHVFSTGAGGIFLSIFRDLRGELHLFPGNSPRVASHTSLDWFSIFVHIPACAFISIEACFLAAGRDRRGIYSFIITFNAAALLIYNTTRTSQQP